MGRTEGLLRIIAMRIKNKIRLEETILFFLVTTLMALENSLDLVFMSGLFRGQPGIISGFARFGTTYGLLLLIIALTIVINQRRKYLSSSWPIAILYIVLALWAAINDDGGHSQNFNGTLSYVQMPLIGVACMLAYEHMFGFAPAYKWRKVTDVLVVCLITLGLYMIYSQLAVASYYSNKISAVNNVYFVVPLVVYWLCKKNKLPSWGIHLLNIGISLIALKRGAVVATAAMFFVSECAQRGKKDIPRFLLIMIIFAVFSFVFFKVIDSHLYNGFLTERFETITEGSGRLNQFEWALQVIPEVPLYDLVVGHGLDASDIRFNLFLHNDWLRILYDFGLIGLTLYAAIYVFFFAKAYDLWKHRSPYTAAWVACTTFAVCLSLYSSVTWVYILNILPVFGCILGLEMRRKQHLAFSATTIRRQDADNQNSTPFMLS